MAIELNKTTLVVEDAGQTFTFKIPSLRDEARIAASVQGMILEDSAGSSVNESQLDDSAKLLYRTISTFKTLLQSSSATWVYVVDPMTKAPTINPELPAEAVTVYIKFLGELNKFFQGGAPTDNAPSESAVDSKQNIESKPV